MKTRVSVISLTALLALTACGTGGNPTPTTCTAPAVLQGGVCVTPVTTGVVQVNNPNGYNVAFTPNIANTGAVAPGNYTATFSRAGFVNGTRTFTVTAGQTTVVDAPVLVANPTQPTTRGAYYIGADGGLVAIPAADLNNPDKFVFNAWLEDRNPDGTATDGVAVSDTGVVSGTPTLDEETEVAPDRTQNLAVAYVGYRAADGNVYPVAGATVRWNITGVPDYTAFIGGQGPEAAVLGQLNYGLFFGGDTPVIFGAADDGSNDTNFAGGIVPPNTVQPLAVSAGGKQADTITNYVGGTNTPFPGSGNRFPLYNQTGVLSPDVNGITWTTLFANRDFAAAEVIAVASIGDMEIDKVVLNKFFAPPVDLDVDKTATGERLVDEEGNVIEDSEVLTGVDGVVSVVNGQVQMTITVTNDGSQATNINLDDLLNSGNGATYGIVDDTITVDTPTGNAIADGDYVLDPVAGGVPTGNGNTLEGYDGFEFEPNFTLNQGETLTISYWVDASAPGAYCDTAVITSYNSTFFGAFTNVNLADDACALFIAPEFNIRKTFAGGATTAVAAVNTDVPVTITVTNNGNEAGTFEDVREFLTRVNGELIVTTPITYTTTSGTNPAYSVNTPSTGGALEVGGDDSIVWDGDPINLAPGGITTFTFNVRASADGQYCDVAAVREVSFGTPPVSNEACLTVVTPTIDKENSPRVLDPGDTYTSTITVTNPSEFAAINVNLSDTLGLNVGTSNTVQFTGASYSINGGSPVPVALPTGTNAVTTGDTVIQIPAEGEVVFTVTSRVPSVAGGFYCNVATATPTNITGGTPITDRDCVYVNTNVAIQTQLTDTVDPVENNGGANADGRTTYVSVLSSEVLSNEPIANSTVYYAFGSQTGVADSTVPLDPNPAGNGLFTNPTTTAVYYDPTPQRDLVTGAVISDYTNATAAATAFTLVTNTGGEQVLSIPQTITPGGALFVVHTGVSVAPTVPEVNPVTGNSNYSTNYVWQSTGTASGTNYVGTSAEPTSVK